MSNTVLVKNDKRLVLKHAVFKCAQSLTILRERCSDPALSVRKQALQSLTDLLDTFPENKLIQKYVTYTLIN